MLSKQIEAAVELELSEYITSIILYDVLLFPWQHNCMCIHTLCIFMYIP